MSTELSTSQRTLRVAPFVQSFIQLYCSSGLAGLDSIGLYVLCYMYPKDANGIVHPARLDWILPHRDQRYT